MSTRIKTPQSLGRDYKKMLKDYFGKYLYGLEVREEGGRVMISIVYYDYKHIDTVRRELAQMMPEVEFTKLKRDFTEVAQVWALRKMMESYGCDRHPEPVIYVQRGDTLVKSSLRDIAFSELCQLELDDDDDIRYELSYDITLCCNLDEMKLADNSID